MGNPPSTLVIIVFVFGFSFLLLNSTLPAFDARWERIFVLINSSCFVQVLRDSTFKKVGKLSFGRKKKKKRQRQNATPVEK